MTKKIGILREFGLTEKQAKLYLLLIKLGSAKSGILMKKLDIYSKTTYELLNKLMEKGLVGYCIKSGVKYYKAVDPEKFMDLIKEQEQQLKIRKKQFYKILPELKKISLLAKKEQDVNIFSGKQSLKTIFEDTLKKSKSQLLIFDGGGYFKKTFPNYSELWHKKRVKKKIRLKLLWNKQLKTKKPYVHKYAYTNLKYLPKEFDNPAPAIIYNNKVALIIWSEKPFAILIESKEIYKTYKSYFNMLWDIATP